MPKTENLVERIYKQLKDDIFDFRLLPGDRFTESEVSKRVKASRTPVREALFRLQQEGYLDVGFRSGWQVKALDFRLFEELYELRILIEGEAVKRLCSFDKNLRKEKLGYILSFWTVAEKDRIQNGYEVSLQDEIFHETLVSSCGNQEMLKIYRSITEKIRILRRLDFTETNRLRATYEEHGVLLSALLEGNESAALKTLTSHIEESKLEVRKISLQKFQDARRPVEKV